jgi:hypothetical protein
MLYFLNPEPYMALAVRALDEWNAHKKWCGLSAILFLSVETI